MHHYNRLILIFWLVNIFGHNSPAEASRPKVLSSNILYKAPSSGQHVRLVHADGSSYWEGQVEMFTQQGFGIVCNLNYTTADILCKQIGFSRGAKSVTSLRFRRNTEKTLFLKNVVCGSSAETGQQCRWNAMTECPNRETAHVVCHENEGCPDGWVAGPTSCYQLLPNTVTHHEYAVNKCEEHGAFLAAIETETENHFISNAYLHYTKGPVLTSGLQVDGSWMWESMSHDVDGLELQTRTQTPIRNFKWFPGWQPGSVMSQPTGSKKERCLFLSNTFQQPDGQDSTVDYLFWLNNWCYGTRKRFQSGFQYICEKSVRSTEEVGCYDDIGSDYRGFASYTKTGLPCMKWSEAADINPLTYPNAGLGEHNFCRNPDLDSMPWCWTSPGHFEFCNIPKCNTRPINTALEVNASLEETACNADEFMCSSTICIAAHWRCDMEYDCETRDDEDGCEYRLNEFKKTEDMSVRGHEEEIYAGATNETCAKYCKESKKFVCQAFSFSPRTRECLLSRHNSEMAQFKPSRREDLFEIVSQLNECEGLYRCDNSRCVAQSDVCDGIDQCGDFSDEKECEEEGDVTVSLVGGTSLSGWVNVTYGGESGFICNDNWDNKDAQVICRMLGFNGKAEVLHKHFFGFIDGDFLLDDVECDGTEPSIDQCDHNGWRNHDCFIWEMAGVTCSEEEVVKCNANTEFTCSQDSMCISLQEVCDGHCQCTGCSDEKTCVSQLELVGGSTPSEGRVEMVLNGVRGTICDDAFDDVAATIVCRLLGYGKGSVVKEEGLFGQGKGVIWMDDVTCVGNETDIIKCPHYGPRDQNCEHNEDVAVVCHVSGVQVELEGGNDYSGRVILINDGVRGTICDDDWTDTNAEVVCRMLGLSGGLALSGDYYGAGDESLSILLDDVRCRGTEASIDECQHAGRLEHNCDHEEDAGVSCNSGQIITSTHTKSWETSTVLTAAASSDETDADCIKSGLPYKGKIAETENGFECQRWVLNSPHQHKHHNNSVFPDGSVAAAENFCRSPDGDPQPWCYTTHPDERWGYCEVPKCAENCFTIASEYMGRTRHTSSGYMCQAWQQDSPHMHKYHSDSSFPEDSVDDARNYCRSPDGDATPWCYTTNADVRWEYCNVSRCAVGSFNFTGSCGLRPLEHSRARREVESEDMDDFFPYSYNKMGRIYGGSEATYGMYPWQARIRRRLSGYLSYHLHHCGGTIIGEYWIVSAAHCFRDASKTQVVVKTGDQNSGYLDKYEQEFEVEKIIIHEQYLTDDYDFDIALLKLRPNYGRGIVFNDYVQPACLPNETTEYVPGQQCLISGWGQSEDDSQSQYLKAARVPLVDHRTCNRLYKQTISRNMACAGYLTGGTDTCAGDSGGPLVCKLNDKYILMGVVSFGEECAAANAPGVYARVSAFVPWIKEKLAMYG